MTLRTSIRAAILFGAVLVATGAARAENLLVTTFSGSQILRSSGFLKLFPSGSFSQAFFTDADGTVMLSFSSLCAMSTTGTGRFVTSINITVDGKAVYPTDQRDDILCGVFGPSSFNKSNERVTLVTGFDVARAVIT